MFIYMFANDFVELACGYVIELSRNQTHFMIDSFSTYMDMHTFHVDLEHVGAHCALSTLKVCESLCIVDGEYDNALLWVHCGIKVTENTTGYKHNNNILCDCGILHVAYEEIRVIHAC